MSDFSQDIQNFQRHGTYIYKFDNAGNMTFNSSSSNFNQVYVAFPLQTTKYNNDRIRSMYTTEFEEFIPTVSATPQLAVTSDDIQEQLNVVQQENVALKEQLESVISDTNISGAISDQMAIKQVIIELRKAIGQGRVDSDFSDTFPYTAIRKPNT